MKAGRPAKELKVTRADRLQLESIARSQSLPAALSRRAQIVLRLAAGETNSAVAQRIRISRPTVTLWRSRYRERGIPGLHNELKAGRPRSTSDEQIAALVNTARRRCLRRSILPTAACSRSASRSIGTRSFSASCGTSRRMCPRPWRWTATAESILAKIERLCKVINGTSH